MLANGEPQIRVQTPQPYLTYQLHLSLGRLHGWRWLAGVACEYHNRAFSENPVAGNLRAEGHSYRAMGRALGVSEKTAWKDINESPVTPVTPESEIHIGTHLD